MSGATRVRLLVDDEARRRECLESLQAAAETAVTSEGAADCVVTDRPEVTVPPAVPVVVVGTEPSAATGAEGYLPAPDGDLVGQVRYAVESGSDAGAGDRIRRLHEATADVVAAPTIEELYRRTVEVGETVLGFDICYLLVREGETFVPVTASSTPTDTGLKTVSLDHGLTGHTYETGESEVVDDIESHPHAEAVHGEYASGISVPAGDWGVFQVVSKEPSAFDQRDAELIELLLSYVSETRRRIQVENRLRDRQRTIERLHETTADIVAADSLQAVYDRTVEAAASVLDLEVSTFLRAETVDGDPAREGEADHLTTRATSDSERAPPIGSELPLEAGIAGETYRTGESIVVADVRDNDRAEPYDQTFRSALSVPVGSTGVLQAISEQPGKYDENDRHLVELLVSHVAATLERIHAEESLREERDRLSALFENVPDPVVAVEMVDGRPVVDRVNGPFEETFGYDGAEIEGADLDDVVVPAGEDDADLINERALAGERFQTEVRRETADGTRDFLLHVAPVSIAEYGGDGYAIYTDITDQKRRERDLQRQNDRLDRFAGIVSHDLRNPLQVAQGRLELARETGEAEHFERAADAHDHMQRLIDDLLALARRGAVADEGRPVALAETAERAWRRVDPERAELVVPDDNEITADPDRLAELLENLFDNAATYGGEDVTVTLGTLPDGFYVADDGPGIPAEKRERVFESGYTTSGGGTGLGLAIVEEIASAHGWDVALTESAAGGARFEVRGVETRRD